MERHTVLHLSDLHVGDLYRSAEDIVYNTIRDLEDHKESYSPIKTVVVSGDIFNGQSKEDELKMKEQDIQNAVLFFDILLKKLNSSFCPNLTKNDFLFVPGNHDLMRRPEGEDFTKYKTFLKKFYGESGAFEELYKEPELYMLKVYKKSRLIFLGLNSCKVEKEEVAAEKLEWIDELSFDEYNLPEETVDQIRQQIVGKLENQYKDKWDDYGYISPSQLDDAFSFLKNKVSDHKEYTIITTFHHHFYPFPEIYKKSGDMSLMRNHTDVIKSLQSHKVKIVLHGHKHTPIIRPVMGDGYFKDPNSVIYVFAGGSLGSKRVDNRAFQLLEVNTGGAQGKIKALRFDYKGEELQEVKPFYMPPKKREAKEQYIELLEILKTEDEDLYRQYEDQVRERDNISDGQKVDKVIEYVGRMLTAFKPLVDDLEREPSKRLPQTLYYTLTLFL